MGNKVAKARSEKGDGPITHFGWMKKKASNPPYQFATRYFIANVRRPQRARRAARDRARRASDRA